MRDIKSVHSLMETLLRKEQGQYFTIEEKDEALDAGQKELFKEYYELKYWKALEPFKVTNEPFTTSSDGILTLGAERECFQMAFAGTIAAPVKIRIVTEDELPDALTSALRKVTATSPVGVLSTNGGVTALNLYPQAVYTGRMTYYGLPKSPKYSYTQSGRVITYVPGTSTQLQFTDLYVDKVIAKAMGHLGVSMNEQQIVEFSQYKEKTA